MRMILIFLLTAVSASAQLIFPQPPHTIFGNVRTLTGVIIDNNALEIVFFADGVEVATSALVPDATLDENYRVDIPTFTGGSDTRTYTVMFRQDSQLSPAFLTTGGTFTFTPVPVGLTRIDFLQGSVSDSDADSLPDAFEIMVAGNLTSLSEFGDFDFDGLTDFEEFKIETDPTDFESQVNFKVIRELPGSQIEIAFDVIVGHTYDIQYTSDFTRWVTAQTYLAIASERVIFQISGSGKFYRVGVR